MPSYSRMLSVYKCQNEVSNVGIVKVTFYSQKVRKMSSFLEGIGGVAEKHIAVFDIGYAYTKFGFAGEFSPRCIIPTEIKLESTGETRKIYGYKDERDLYDLLAEFLHMIYFRHAIINPKERTVIIVESLLSLTVFREVLAKVLFCHFEVSNVMWLPSHLVSLSTLATDTALVVDVGYKETVAFPVCYGVSVLKAWQALPLGSETVHKSIKNLLKQESILTETILEDIKVRTCFVTTLERSQLYTTNEPPNPPPSVEYPVKGNQVINISGKVRELAFEVMFERDNDFQSVSTMILDAVLLCPVDLRKPLLENILIIGGTSMIPGFKSRIKEELQQLLKCDKYREKFLIEKIKFHKAPAKENYTAWLGGSIYGTTDLVTMQSLSKETYLRDRRVPDWSNLNDNRRETTNIG